MKSVHLCLFAALAAVAITAAGCNGQPKGTSYTPIYNTRPADPQFQNNMKNLEVERVTWHTVEKGETYSSLSRKYGVPVAAIAAANPHIDPKALGVGMKLAIPGYASATPEAPRPPVTVAPPPAAVKTRDVGRLRYPVVGTARDSKGQTPGVEFSVSVGASVVASEGGKVVVASPDLAGLGPTVIIDHGGGLCTLYGRLADFAVKPDQKVERGDPIGRCGGTPMLFRVYEGPAAQSPASYLNKK